MPTDAILKKGKIETYSCITDLSLLSKAKQAYSKVREI